MSAVSLLKSHVIVVFTIDLTHISAKVKVIGWLTGNGTAV